MSKDEGGNEDIVPRVVYHSEQGQRLLLVMRSIKDLGYGEWTKREVITYIKENGWFAVEKGDFKPFNTQSEPRLDTYLAWGRKHGELRDWITYNQRDAWGLNSKGRHVLEASLTKFSTSKWDVAKCYLWSQSSSVCYTQTMTPQIKIVYGHHLDH